MDIRFQSTVLITTRFKEMKRFYTEMLGQGIRLDFGACITFDCALTIWEMREEFALARTMGTAALYNGNASMEVCFETDNFDAEATRVKAEGITLVHDVEEEPWGQRTLRFLDPDDNIVELGESIPCFCRRLHAEGMVVEAVARKTGVDATLVETFINK